MLVYLEPSKRVCRLQMSFYISLKPDLKSVANMVASECTVCYCVVTY